MADNIGKPGSEPSLREEVSRASTRRDPRADPDDDPIPAYARVEVFNVDRTPPKPPESTPPNDPLGSAALTLRRELAKLHQQAAAVERTIEDQRRERSEALERMDVANARVFELEKKVELAESETGAVRRLHEAALSDLQKVRTERDELARGLENAKATTEELGRLRAELEMQREAHDAVVRAASRHEAELAEIRKREQAGAQKMTDAEAELTSARERFERTNAELTQVQAAAAQSKTEIVQLKQEASSAAEAHAKARDDAERELAASKEQVERLEKSLAEARIAEQKLSVAESDLTASRREATEARADATRLERDLEVARHARDVGIERATMAERETEETKKDVERLQRELEAANANAARSEARAVTAERERSSVEESVRQLRDEVTSAFARWKTVVPSTTPGPMTSSVAPPTRRAVPSSPGVPSELALDDHGWSAPPPPPSGSAKAPPSGPPRPPPSGPPKPPEVEAVARSSPPAMRARSKPPLPPRRSSPSIPPAVYPSVPPPAGLSATTPPPLSRVGPPKPQLTEQERGGRKLPSIAPLASATTPSTRPGQSAPPKPVEERSGVHLLAEEREQLLERLADPDTARPAATLLCKHPEWLKGRPPVELVIALTCLDYDVEAPIFELARGWEREPMSRAVIAALRDEPEPKLREHGAWLLKHLGAPSALPAMTEIAKDDSEAAPVRRWLLEAIERLVVGHGLVWRDVSDVVSTLARHSDASLRDGVVGIVAALERSDDKRKLLLDLLRTDDNEVVLASAVHALTSVLPIELDPVVAERLLGHPSARVQRSVMDFIERSKRAARN